MQSSKVCLTCLVCKQELMYRLFFYEEVAISGGFTVQPQELCFQCAKKVVSDSPGLVDFATGLVNSVLNLPDRQVTFWGEVKLQKNCNQYHSLKKKKLGV